MNLEEIKEKIRPLDAPSMEKAKERWMSVAKPLFGLGKLEDAIVRMAGIKGTPTFDLDKKGLIIMCADNGVVAEGVTQTGQEVTGIVADNFTKQRASVCIMAEIAGVDVFPVDIGMVSDVPSLTDQTYKVAYGTRNLANGPAMTKEETWHAVEVGIRLVKEKKEQGYQILATGEMGIGNTTTSSAVASVLLQRGVEEMTGRGAGLDQKGLTKKIEVIRRAIDSLKPDQEDILDTLSKVGGLDIAGLTGVFLGGALYRVPVVIDGFISSVAALCAVRMAPQAGDYLLPSHVSKEPAGKRVLDALSLSPMLYCDMCLGEGSGAVAVMPLLQMGLSVYQKMGTFADIHVGQYEILE